MAPYTRQAFERQRALMKQAERRHAGILATASVVLGIAQLIFLRWADAHLARDPKLAIAGGAFLAYLAIVGWLLWRLVDGQRRARPKCPQCGASLGDASVRVAAATTRCDACGGQVIG